MMDLETILGTTTSVLTFGMFLTPIPICYKIKQADSTRNVSPTPFLAGLFNCGVWANYGLHVENPMIYVVSAIGAALHILYVGFYYLYCHEKNTFIKKILLTSILLASIVIYTRGITQSSDKAGLIACVAGVLFAAAPLTDLGVVFRTKSTSSMPFPLIFGNTVLSFLYLWYGYVINDRYMQVPNGIATVLSGVTLSLFAVYPSERLHAQ